MPGESVVTPATKTRLLIVDDEHVIRGSLSQIFKTRGHDVRVAENGLSALAAIRLRVPDILLSDLDMPAMSGIELLSVVRRRFPDMRLIAMSGVLSRKDLPLEIAANAFYEKGSGVGCLLKMVEDMNREALPIQLHEAPGTLQLSSNVHSVSGEPYVKIKCPECFRTFLQVFRDGVSLIHEADCIYCSGSVRYAVLPAPGRTSQRLPRIRTSALRDCN